MRRLTDNEMDLRGVKGGKSEIRKKERATEINLIVPNLVIATNLIVIICRVLLLCQKSLNRSLSPALNAAFYASLSTRRA